MLADELGEWSKDDSKDNAWGMGCAALELKDTDNMTGILVVSDGASLTLGENAVIDAASKDNAILLAGKSQLVITEEAVIKNGRYANIIVNKDAT